MYSPKAIFSISIIIAVASMLLLASPSAAFAPTNLANAHVHRGPGTSLNDGAAYVPDGLSPEEYQRIKAQDLKKKQGKDLGRLGPRGFKSRSMQAWQEAYERGETGHTFAPLGYRQKLQKGEWKKEQVPYMVRPGGSWDNSDIAGAKRLPWSKKDKEYARGGYKKEQSASIIGSGPGLDWTGTRKREGGEKKSVPGFS